MVTVSGETFKVLLGALVFIFILMIMIPVINYAVNEDFRCSTSIWLAMNRIGPGVLCDVDRVPADDRKIEVDGGARIVAEKMLECHSKFRAGTPGTVLDYRPISVNLFSNAPVQGRIVRGQFSDRNYCFVCSEIEFPDDHRITGFVDYLQVESVQGQSFFSRLYEASPRSNRYIGLQSSELNGRVAVLYSEGTLGVSGDVGGQVASGVVAVDLARAEAAVGDERNDYFAQLCGGYVAR